MLWIWISLKLCCVIEGQVGTYMIYCFTTNSCPGSKIFKTTGLSRPFNSTKQQILDSSKIKEFADNNLNFDDNVRKFF